MLEWKRADWERAWAEEPGPFAVFIHTPLCGTCKLAGKMLEIASSLRPDYRIYTVNLNMMPAIAQVHRIESVPCLLVKGKDGAWSKTYRFPSIQDILGQLDKEDTRI